MATVTVYTVDAGPTGQKKVWCGVTPSSNYTLGGESLEATNFGLNAMTTLMIAGMANGYALQWDNTAGKVKLFALSNGATLNGSAMIASQGGVNCTGMVFPAIAIGKGTY